MNKRGQKKKKTETSNKARPKKVFSRLKFAPFIFLAPALFTYFLLLSSTDTGQNWLTDWDYRQSFVITNSTASELTNYQVSTTIDTQTIISASRIQSDCDDIRFTDSDGSTLLDFWIESGCNSASTIIWVKVSSIAASSSTNIYFYYGNSDASSGEAAYTDAMGPYTENLVTGSPGWARRAEQGSLVYDNKMWIFGGGDELDNFYNDVWYSTDGITWTEATSSAGWTTRYGMGVVEFDNKMWLYGGYKYSGDYRNDVWYSTDGITWTEATSSAAWLPRLRHGALVYDNKMWVLGGFRSGPIYKNDVWYSTDGITWTEATSSAAWAGREAAEALVYDNKMWVIGGNQSATFFNDVWYSTDGITWTEATSSAAWVPTHRGKTSAVFNDRMWILGSEVEAWFSTDGITWTEATSSVSWPQLSQGVAVYQDKIWIIGGYDLDTSAVVDDVYNFAYRNLTSPEPSATSGSTALVSPTIESYDVQPRSIGLAWATSTYPAGTTFYANNSTLDTNSSWIDSNGYIFEELICETDYEFQIKAQNSGTESAYSATSTISTATCPGAPAAPPSPPTGDFWVWINNGDETTTSSTVTLTLDGGTDVEYMTISNVSDFSDPEAENYQIPYVTSTEWDLCMGIDSCEEGTYSVYVKFLTAYGLASEIIFDGIYYGTTTQAEVSVPTPEEPTTEPEPEIETSDVGLRTPDEQVPEPEPELAISCPYFVTPAELGDKNEEVSKIQKFLADQGLFSGVITGIYDGPTFAAVKVFQDKYTEDILYPWGLSQSTGWWYITTINKANELLGCKDAMPENLCPYFTKYLNYGDKDREVFKVQQFLMEQELFFNEINGIFDYFTLNAVREFQVKYFNEILKPWGLTKSTGSWYITTIKKANELMECEK
ncbi:MAG: DUF2341 domain-containing protein [Patescibacteria group bacterium]